MHAINDDLYFIHIKTSGTSAFRISRWRLAEFHQAI